MTCALPPWLRIQPPSGEELKLFGKVSKTLSDLKLNTICETGKCPNKAECWGCGTTTFLIMGNVCTRNCRFCNSATAARGEKLDESEPQKISDAVKQLGLSYVVITSVDRDDLPDQGAEHIAATIRAIKKGNPMVLVEALIPDFRGNKALLEKVVQAKPDVLSHNIEVVKELQKTTRDARANYEQSLNVLANAKKINPSIVTKSSLMIGLGETEEQIEQAMNDLLEVGVEMLTIGQYLQPSSRCLSVKEFIAPEKFEEFRKTGLKKGFKAVVCAPFARSSYKAGELFAKQLIKDKKKLTQAKQPVKKGKSVFKAGKLIKVFLDYDDKIQSIKITGDFFVHPEEKIADIEKGLVGTVVDEKKIIEKLVVLLDGVQVFGFDEKQLAHAIMLCVQEK